MIETLPALAPLTGRRAEQVAEALKRYILINHLAPETRLPTERQLASALMVGRNQIREALNSLVTLGIVEKRQGSGIYVRDFDADRLAEQLSYGLREDAAYWLHLYEARVEIETTMAQLAARRITDEQLGTLRSLLEEMRREVADGQSLVHTDIEFHQALVAAGRNPVLERLARAVIAEYFRQTASLSLGLTLVGDSQTLRNHEPLIAALAARDPVTSAEAMRYHFRQIRGLMDNEIDSLGDDVRNR